MKSTMCVLRHSTNDTRMYTSGVFQASRHQSMIHLPPPAPGIGLRTTSVDRLYIRDGQTHNPSPPNHHRPQPPILPICIHCDEIHATYCIHVNRQTYLEVGSLYPDELEVPLNVHGGVLQSLLSPPNKNNNNNEQRREERKKSKRIGRHFFDGDELS